MSRRPGIGAGYFEKHERELWTHDSIIHNGREASVPRFYDKLLKRSDPERFAELKQKRIDAAREPARRGDNTPERLASREKVKTARHNLKSKRNL